MKLTGSYFVTYTQQQRSQFKNRHNKNLATSQVILSYTPITFSLWHLLQAVLHDKLKTKGINYDTTPSRFLKSNKENITLINSTDYIAEEFRKSFFATDEQSNVVERISKYFDHLFIDEIQDFWRE